MMEISYLPLAIEAFAKTFERMFQVQGTDANSDLTSLLTRPATYKFFQRQIGA
jgi:hypothetical protein